MFRRFSNFHFFAPNSSIYRQHRQALTLELVSGNAARMIPRWSSSCRSSRLPSAAILWTHKEQGTGLKVTQNEAKPKKNAVLVRLSNPHTRSALDAPRYSVAFAHRGTLATQCTERDTRVQDLVPVDGV